MTRTLTLLTAAAVALALALSLATGASAQTTSGAVVIDGFPLKIFSGPDGRTQVQADGSGVGEFYPPSSDSGHAGFDVMLDPQGSEITYGAFSGFLPTPDSGPTLAPGNPATITTVWTLNDSNGSPALRLTQVLSYTSGSRQFDGHYTVQNISSSPQSFRANVAGDLAIRGSDTGIGFLTPGPPRFMGGLNQDVGAAGGFVEESPGWSAFESNQLSPVSTGAGDATGPGFDNSIAPLQPPPVDNAAGVQWDNFYPPNSLAPNQSFTFNVGWRFIDTLGITPLIANQQTGNEQDLTATVGDLNGNSQAGQKVVWTVQGANSATGTSTSAANGQATFAYVGGNPGQDQVTAFVDQNGNGVRDPNEPQATATVNWTGPPPPIAGVNVGVRPEAGTVKIKLPKGTSPIVAKRFGVTSAAKPKFVKLTAGADIPVGSTVDTTKGRVRLLSAAAPFGNTFQGGSFNGSQFLVGQGHGGGLTTLSMAGGNLNSCGKKTPKGGAARRRGRSLFSNVHGRFRTRGRNSSATVRGTVYLVKDSCKGTLTQVTRGVVTVRDFTLRKNKTVKAGHKYLARPPKH